MREEAGKERHERGGKKGRKERQERGGRRGKHMSTLHIIMR